MFDVIFVLLELLVQPLVITLTLIGLALAYYFGLFETPSVIDETALVFAFFLAGLYLERSRM